MQSASDASVNKILKVLSLIFLIIAALYFAREFFVPLTIASLLAFLFLPLTRRLERMGIAKIFSILICLLIILIVLLGLIIIFSSHVISFSENLPELELKAKEKFHRILSFVESATKIPSSKQKEWLNEMNQKFLSSNWIENIFFTTSNLILTLGLILVYVFCFLYYRSKFSSFFLSFSKHGDVEQGKNVMIKIQKLSSRYFSGVFMVMAILGTMHSIGLLLLGIEHAIFLGFLAASFILVPIVGTMVGSSIPILVAILTKDSLWYAVGVAGVFSFNLFMESQVLTPLILGSHIKINPMAVIIAIVIGSFIWGLPGMVLFIPLTGMLKIISDNIDSLYPLRILLSDDTKKSDPGFFKKIIKKIKD